MLFQSRGTIKHIQNGGHENAHKVCLRDVYRPCKRLKNYQKEKYTDKSALEYYEKSVDHYMIHPDTKAMLEYLLVMLSVKGEEYTYSYIKKEVLKGHIPYEKDKINQLEQGLHV